MTSETGFVTTPYFRRFSSNYDLECVWTIRAPPGNKVQFAIRSVVVRTVIPRFEDAYCIREFEPEEKCTGKRGRLRFLRVFLDIGTLFSF